MFERNLASKCLIICRDRKAEVGRIREEKLRKKKNKEEKEWEARRFGCVKREEERDLSYFSFNLRFRRVEK